MPRGYAQLGDQAGKLLATMVGGKQLRDYGRNAQIEDNLANAGSYAELVGQQIKNSQGARELETGPDDILSAFGVDPRLTGALDTFRESGNYGTQPHMGEGFNGDYAMGTDVITEAPEGLTPAAIDMINTIRGAHATKQAGIPTDLLDLSRDLPIEQRMAEGSLSPNDVRDRRSALAGKYAPTGSSTQPPPGMASWEWELMKRLGTGPGAAAFIDAYRANGGDFDAALTAARDQFTEDELIGALGLNPLGPYGVADNIGKTPYQQGMDQMQALEEMRRAVKDYNSPAAARGNVTKTYSYDAQGNRVER